MNDAHPINPELQDSARGPLLWGIAPSGNGHWSVPLFLTGAKTQQKGSSCSLGRVGAWKTAMRVSNLHAITRTAAYRKNHDPFLEKISLSIRRGSF